MAIDFSNLKIELLTGSFAATFYSANVTRKDYNALADTINTRGTTGSMITIGILTAYNLQRLVVGSEYLVLSAGQRDLWNAILTTAAGQGGIAVSDTLIRGQVTQVWSATTQTRSNLVSAQTRLMSRGESLFGEGTIVDINAIYVALTQ